MYVCGVIKHSAAIFQLCHIRFFKTDPELLLFIVIMKGVFNYFTDLISTVLGEGI